MNLKESEMTKREIEIIMEEEFFNSFIIGLMETNESLRFSYLGQLFNIRLKEPIDSLKTQEKLFNLLEKRKQFFNQK